MHSFKEWEAANHVLFHLTGSEGFQPGSFTTSLLDTANKADRANFDRLRFAFPLEMLYLSAAKNDYDGLDLVRRVAKSKPSEN